MFLMSMWYKMLLILVIWCNIGKGMLHASKWRWKQNNKAGRENEVWIEEICKKEKLIIELKNRWKIYQREDSQRKK